MRKLSVKRILVPIDFSGVSLAALDQAVFMARLFKADLQLIHVIDIPPTVYAIENPMSPGFDISNIEKEIGKKMDTLSRSIRKSSGLEIKTLITRGKTSYEIVDYVKETEADIVVMGTHGASGFDEYFIGSNAHKVTTLCPCPVISVRKKAKKAGYSNILLPIDNSLHSREKVNMVMVLAKKFGSVIHILGLPEDNEPLHMKQFRIKLNSVESIIKKAGLACTLKVAKKGNIAELAMKHAGTVKADLIAIMTDHESQYGIFKGPFAKQIVNHSRIPVMSIHSTEGKFEDMDYGATGPF